MLTTENKIQVGQRNKSPPSQTSIIIGLGKTKYKLRSAIHFNFSFQNLVPGPNDVSQSHVIYHFKKCVIIS
jgi:hypothetical protein